MVTLSSEARALAEIVIVPTRLLPGMAYTASNRNYTDLVMNHTLPCLSEIALLYLGISSGKNMAEHPASGIMQSFFAHDPALAGYINSSVLLNALELWMIDNNIEGWHNGLFPLQGITDQQEKAFLELYWHCAGTLFGLKPPATPVRSLDLRTHYAKGLDGLRTTKQIVDHPKGTTLFWDTVLSGSFGHVLQRDTGGRAQPGTIMGTLRVRLEASDAEVFAKALAARPA